ncbi:MAG: hypothetical protein ABII71_01010 [Candidatus Micrarchaeota archaeon]
MAAIRKSDFEKMSRKEMEAKVLELERLILEFQGEGKRDKARPLRKAIASLKTRLGSAQSLNTGSAPNISAKPETKKVTGQK